MLISSPTARLVRFTAIEWTLFFGETEVLHYAIDSTIRSVDGKQADRYTSKAEAFLRYPTQVRQRQPCMNLPTKPEF
jgi:hypothetical protein